MLTLLVLLVFIGIPLCLLLTFSDRSFLKSALRFAQAQQQSAKEHLARIKLLSRRRNNTAKIAAIFAIAVIAGHAMSSELAAQVTPPSLTSLKSVPVPGPSSSELSAFIKDKTAAIVLGKSLFWDMQVGSDGVQACATCHFHAGADNRSKNQITPGLLRVNLDRTANPDTTFQTGRPNYTLQPGDFPFHKLSDPNDINSTVVADSNDIVSSQGVFNTQFVDVIPGNAKDKVNFLPDPVFNVGGTEVRRVEPRNTPTTINAVFYSRNFWDGRAQNIFNGVNPLGKRDPNAKVLRSTSASQPPIFVDVSLKNSSLASQAVGPPLSSLEMSADGRTFQEIGQKFGSIDLRSRSVGKARRLPRQTGHKLFGLRPLGKQLVARDDSVLGPFSRAPQKGISPPTYETLIQSAFKPDWWQSNYIIRVNTLSDGLTDREIIPKPNRPLATNEYTLAEYNFSLFFGLAVQLYESTLVSNNAPIDQYLEGNTNALTTQQQKGMDVFLNKGLCIVCHTGAEFTSASVRNVQNNQLLRAPVPGNPIHDSDFFAIGVTPPLEDLGVGDNDPFGNPLSEARLAQQGKFKALLGQDPNLTIGSTDIVTADGAFKAPTLRNVELTAPYFHNGGQLTLRQVVDFYSRGGDFGGLPVLNLTEEDKEALVAFMKGLTDERVRYRRAPFDHPQLFIPNGHPGNQNSVTADGNGKATDELIELPAVGRNGGTPLPNFLANSQS